MASGWSFALSLKKSGVTNPYRTLKGLNEQQRKVINDMALFYQSIRKETPIDMKLKKYTTDEALIEAFNRGTNEH